MIYLPASYNEEIFYSVVARYLTQTGQVKASRITHEISDRVGPPSVCLPTGLKIVSERTEPLWCKTGEEIARELTLFPYYARYLSINRVWDCLKKMLSSNGMGVQLMLGVINCRVKMPIYLRYCKVCRERDIKQYGETWWRRCHQLPGVLVCPDHGSPLIETAALMNPTGCGDYIDATEITAKINSDGEVLEKEESKKALMIARRSHEMLQGPIKNWESDNITLRYRNAALERGFINGAYSLSVEKLEKDFKNFYGKKLLRKLGCDFLLGRNTSWFRNIFRFSHKTFPPLHHVLVQIFLENVSVNSKNIPPFGFGPWKCPNPHGKHAEEYPIKDPLIYMSYKHRKYVASAQCSCGFHFTFHSISQSDPRVPIVSKVMQYGPTWEAETRKLRNSGLSILAIANKMGVDDSNIKNILEKKRPVNRVTPLKIKRWRKEWLQLLNKVPNRSRQLARKKNKGLYSRLLRNDRTWFLSGPRQWNHDVKYPQRVDWKNRDKEWSLMLKKSSQKIHKLVPLVRRTPMAIIKAAQLPRKLLSTLSRLPKCKSVLGECAEPLNNYQERRMRHVAAKMREEGTALFPSKLLVRASLRRIKLTPHLSEVLTDLCR